MSAGLSPKASARLQAEFKTLRRQTTVFCALVTGAIFLIMTVFCLLFSENSLRDSQHQSFISDVKSVVSYLDAQRDVSWQWLSSMEDRGKLSIFIYDNSVPLLRNSMPAYGRDQAEMDDLARQAIATAQDVYGLDIFKPMRGMLSHYAEFSLRDSSGKELYAAAAAFPRDGRSFGLVALYPLDRLEQRLASQRKAFAVIGLTGLIALGIFAWIFSGRILRPIAENRRSQAQFLAAASHELRSPLAVILSSLSSMDTAGPQEQQRFKEHIRAEGGRMSRLIGDLLSLASADSRAWTLHLTPTEPDTLVLELYDSFSSSAYERGIKLDVSLPEGIMKPHNWDAVRLSQALAVLLDNALSYTPKGGSVLLSVEELANGKCRFIVRDNGPGIPKEERERIFQRFYRLENSHTDKDHFGLGLCIAREIVLLHRGKLWVQDAPGGGAEFRLIV